MRNTILIKSLLIILLLHINTNSIAITTKASNNFSWGLKAGTSYNSMYKTSKYYEQIHNWEHEEDLYGRILWFIGGLTGEYSFLQHFSAAAEVLYERKGLYIPEWVKFQQETINLPVLIKYYPVATGVGLSLQWGLKPSFAFSKKYYGLTGNFNEKQTEKIIKEEDLTDWLANICKQHKTFNLELISGLEYKFVNGFNLGFTMSLGLIERRDNKDSKIKNIVRSIGKQFYIGYNFANLF